MEWFHGLFVPDAALTYLILLLIIQTNMSWWWFFAGNLSVIFLRSVSKTPRYMRYVTSKKFLRFQIRTKGVSEHKTGRNIYCPKYLQYSINHWSNSKALVLFMTGFIDRTRVETLHFLECKTVFVKPWECNKTIMFCCFSLFRDFTVAMFRRSVRICWQKWDKKCLKCRKF